MLQDLVNLMNKSQYAPTEPLSAVTVRPIL